LKAFVLIQAQPGAEPLGAALRALPGIEWTDDLTGPYDAIALASAESTQALFESVVPTIRALPGVTRALPATVVVSLSPARSGRDEAA
jgi:Lrp/AsnC ligand binding domain